MKTLDHHKKSRLAHSVYALLVSGVLCNSAFALQSLEDEHLEEVTGEGIAFVLDDFSMRWNGADTANSGEGTYSTGYARLIPVGPLSSLIQGHNDATYSAACATLPNSCTDSQKSRAKYDTNIGKGDVYLYGVAISANDGDANTQFSGNTVDVGTAENPWLFITKTDTIPNFSGDSKSLTSMNFEAPLLTNLVDSDGALLTTDPNSYDLKVALWADAFVRDPSVIENGTGEFALNGATRPTSATDTTAIPRENRLRLQAIMNGVSLNGTQIQMFQTLNGAATSGNGLGTAYNHYNNTFGLAGTVRINSGDSRSVRAPVYSETSTDNTVDNTVDNTGTWGSWNNLHGGWDSSLNAGQTSGNCNNGSSVTVSTNFGAVGCQFMVQTRTRTDTKTRTVTKTSAWSATGLTNDHVMRISTREKNDTDVLSSPAISLASNNPMPEFAENEGIFFYQPNINLVVGTLWQPLIFASDGTNFSIEITRIPNVAAVYKEIYTDYTGQDASYKGGTCSIYWCGGDGNGISKNATHSSISIGSTEVTLPNGNVPLSLNAYKGVDALGVSFGDLAAVDGTTATNTASTTSAAATATQAQWVQRANNNSTTWTYRNNSVGSTRTGTANQWSYGGTVVSPLVGVTNATWQAASTRYRYPIASGDTNTWSSNTTTAGLCGNSNCTYYGTTANRNWTYADTKGLAWSTAENTTLNDWLASQGSAARSGTIANQAATPALPSVTQPTLGGVNPVNLGSAVIDGLLIQHFKMTTKGL